LKAIGEVFKSKEDLCGKGSIKVGGENVYNLSANQSDISNSLTVKVNLSPDQSDKKEDLESAIKGACSNVSDAKVEITCNMGIGNVVTTVENVTEVMEDKSTTFSHKKGEVILLDFWATWCPPCQRPMAHNQEMLEKNASKWNDKVRIVGFSIDSDSSTVKNHVQNKGWTKVEHYWVRNGKCTADKDYGVRGVPHCVLLDTNGKIVFIGHPASRTLEEDIDKLLKGETISGAGTTAGGDEDEDEGGDSPAIGGEAAERAI